MIGHSRRTVALTMWLGLAVLAGPNVAAASAGDVPGWGFDVRGSRSNGAEHAITAGNVHRLKLKWAFAVPGELGQQSQPAVVGRTLYVGGTNGVFYALNAGTGRLRWRFDTKPVVHAGVAGNALRDGPAVANGIVYFGDHQGDVFALDAKTGRLRWMTRVDSHPAAVMTSSPLVYNGRVIIGVSSQEEGFATAPLYACCTFRGSLVALNASTGALLWRDYMLPNPPAPTGVSSFGPSGVAIWSSPAIDPATGTVFVGTGNNYSGTSSSEDAIAAFDVTTGAQKWLTQLTNADTWNFSCISNPGIFNCPSPGSDFDFGASPNVFKIGGRTVVGEGQKSGVYHVLDAATGSIVWQALLNNASGSPVAAGFEGIEWGTSYDGHRIYAATDIGKPAAMFGIAADTGKIQWRTPLPPGTCLLALRHFNPGLCIPSLPDAVSSTPGLVWAGGVDGVLRAYSSVTGKVLWSYDTIRFYHRTTDHVLGLGGSIDGGGPVVANGTVYTNSGYVHFGIPLTEIGGNVVLAFATH